MSSDDRSAPCAMGKTATVCARSYQRDGRLVPRPARGLRARAVTLRPRGVMEWHSTRGREELVMALTGTLSIEVASSPPRVHRLSLQHGQCAFLPARTRHRVVNRSRGRARYIYVTAPAR